MKRGPKEQPKLSTEAPNQTPAQAPALRVLVRDLRDKELLVTNEKIGEQIEPGPVSGDWVHHRLKQSYKLTYRDARRLFKAMRQLAEIRARSEKVSPEEVTAPVAKLADFQVKNPWIVDDGPNQRFPTMHVFPDELDLLSSQICRKLSKSRDNASRIGPIVLERIERTIVSYFQDSGRRFRMSEALAVLINAKLNEYLKEKLDPIYYNLPNEEPRRSCAASREEVLLWFTTFLFPSSRSEVKGSKIGYAEGERR